MSGEFIIFVEIPLCIFHRRLLWIKRNRKHTAIIVGSYIYDPAVGDPDGGIAPGTAFEDIPEDWVCPLCGVGKEDFEPVEE